MRITCKAHGETDAFKFPWETDNWRCLACKHEAAIKAAGVPKRFFSATCAPENAIWLSSARGSWATLLLLGNTGTGKTHQACGIIRAAVESGLSALYVHAEDMSKEIMANGAERFIKPALLVIDEIGRGFDTPKERDRLLRVIDGRYNNLLPLVICGNVKPDRLKEITGDAATDRIRETATTRMMVGESLRAHK